MTLKFELWRQNRIAGQAYSFKIDFQPKNNSGGLVCCQATFKHRSMQNQHSAGHQINFFQGGARKKTRENKQKNYLFF